MDYECKNSEHKVVRQQPGHMCPEGSCFHWTTDCGVCAGQHRALHQTGATCPDCGSERLFLTRTWRWPRHGGDGNPDNRCKTSGRKFIPPEKEVRYGISRR